MRAVLTRRAARAAVTALLGLPIAAAAADAQRAPPPAPSRADSLLALGRLAAAEEALYAAAAARPRAPEARGALGLYLASRARFRIAETLFWEAVQFGADSGSALRAVAMMAPYRVRAAEGPVVTVPLRPATDARSIGVFPIRPRRAMRDEVTAEFDPTVSGLVVGRRAAADFAAGELWIGDRRLTGIAMRVDSVASPGAVRVGLDVLWPLRPVIDQRAGTLTLGAGPDRPAAVAGTAAGSTSVGASHATIPFVLRFPGLALVPRPGTAPVAIESRAGRELLRGARWWVDAERSVIVVER